MTTQQNSPGKQAENRSPYIEPRHTRSKWLTVALWGVYAALAFFFTWSGKDFVNEQLSNSVLVTVISTLSFAVGNAFALLDLRKNTPWAAWRPAYTAVGIIISVIFGVAFRSFSLGGCMGITAIVIMRSLYGPHDAKRQRTAHDIGV